MQRHWCHQCQGTYSESSALLVRGSWYTREVHRYAIDQWQHVGSSLRRTAEWVRSFLGRQARWLLWRPLAAPSPEGERCYLSASRCIAGWMASEERPKRVWPVSCLECLAAGKWAVMACGPDCVAKERKWCWRDFRLRLSHGRNHGSSERLERAALVWGIYRNFTPAQGRCERKRHYRRSGQSPLAMAGVAVGEASYLDALGV